MCIKDWFKLILPLFLNRPLDLTKIPIADFALATPSILAKLRLRQAACLSELFVRTY